MVANFPADDLVGNCFKEWWENLGKEVDKENLKTSHNPDFIQESTKQNEKDEEDIYGPYAITATHTYNRSNRVYWF